MSLKGIRKAFLSRVIPSWESKGPKDGNDAPAPLSVSKNRANLILKMLFVLMDKGERNDAKIVSRIKE